MSRSSCRAVSFIELILVMSLVAIVLAGLLAAYVACYDLNQTSKNMASATNGARQVLEEIRAHSFGSISDDYDGFTFQVNGLSNSRGRVYVDDSDLDLLKITIEVCWRQMGARVVGEDKNLNGSLDAGEDANGNGALDSPVQIVTLLTPR